MATPPKQIQVAKTLDVEAVEQALAELWQETSGEPDEPEVVVLRARAANLMVFLANEAALPQTQQTIRELAGVHPCRAFVMLADREGPPVDIEMFVSASSQLEGRSKKPELCCEEVTLVARGHFSSELPSAVTPLLVPDLPIFLWWQDLRRLNDDTFRPLSLAADRLVIDSVDLAAMNLSLEAVERLFSRKTKEVLAVSDINWARLTSWRALLANFYDVSEYRPALEDLERVTIEYVAPESDANGIAVQALLIAGWLASRLQWNLSSDTSADNTHIFLARRQDGGEITLELKRLERPAIKPGRLAKIELLAKREEASFVVKRADNGLHLETQATVEGRLCPGSTLPVRNRTTAQLLAREMEILVNDITYEAAVRVAASMGQ
jgi:glucose-6-phosphate dehydrogenase assembly protein OpcA